MAQEINEVGLILVNEYKNVVFTERVLKNIFLDGEKPVLIEFEKKSNAGSKTEIRTIDFEKFHTGVESLIWELVDLSLGEG